MANTMTSALEKFSNEALCQWLNQPGSATAVGVLASSAIAVPDPITTAAGLGLLAMQLRCSFANPTPNPSNPAQEGCQGREVPTFVQFYDPGYLAIPPGWVSSVQDENFEIDMSEVQYIVGITGQKESQAQGVPVYQVIADYVLKDGRTVSVTNSSITYAPVTQLRMFDNGSACTKEPNPNPEPAPDPPLQPITGFSEDLNCTITAELKNWIQTPSGNFLPVIQYSSEGDGTRANGGIIGGCNWYGDLIYVGGEGCECPKVSPLPPGPPGPPIPPQIPDWLEDILAGLGSEYLKEYIDGLFEQPIPGITYQMFAPCEKDAKGDPLVWEKQIPSAPWLDALGFRITALQEQMSQHLAWKTPICNDRPELKGNWRTISFRSSEVSPTGNTRLRKRFRYRSLSGLGLGEVVDHWKDFTFQSGSIIVSHKGYSWGTPQVWAATVDEGKRVIQHAAREAGFDADQVGEWRISHSSSARYGLSDTMSVDTKGGYYWITARDGSDNSPIVAKTFHP